MISTKGNLRKSKSMPSTRLLRAINKNISPRPTSIQRLPNTVNVFIFINSELKNRLLRFSDDEETETSTEKPEVRKMISEVVELNRNYKRQIKRKRRGSGDSEWAKSESKKKSKVEFEV
jgi:hypothetical protein